MTRRTLGAFAALTMMLAACAGSVAETPEVSETTVVETTLPAPTTTEPPTTTTQPRITTTTEAEISEAVMETLFLAFVRDWSSDKPLNLIDTAPDSMLIDLAMSACEVLDGGGTSDEIAAVVVVSLMEGDNLTDVNVEAVGTVIGAGVEAFCPEHSDNL